MEISRVFSFKYGTLKRIIMYFSCPVRVYLSLMCFPDLEAIGKENRAGQKYD